MVQSSKTPPYSPHKTGPHYIQTGHYTPHTHNSWSTICEGGTRLFASDNGHETARNQLSHNRVINRHPPPVSDTERRLPRVTRTILAQLRSGWSNTLNSYRARIIPGTSDSCPSCNQAPHDTVHIFNCPAKPTALQPIDLWLNPIITADFLGLPTTWHHTTYILNFNEFVFISTPLHLHRRIQAYNYTQN